MYRDWKAEMGNKKKIQKRQKRNRIIFAIGLALIVVIVLGLGIPAILESLGMGNGSENKSNSEIKREEALQDAQDKGLLILVNKEHAIDKNYVPEDLRAIKYFASDRSAETRYMRAEAATAFNQLVEAAAKDNIELKMTTAYRSYSFQKNLFENYVKKEGEEAANRYSAKPGESEHQTGLAVDVSAESVDYQLTEAFGETKEGKWLVKHAYEYGFILRYPKEKEDITGYLYEPWHIRYVGLFAAKEIYEQGVTLEEYLDENNID
jgi:zinc D-Ala-D-Ala carboxypeptidase